MGAARGHSSISGGKYQPNPVVPLIFPWLFSLSGRVGMDVLAAFYETEADLADDGVFEQAPL